MRNWEIKANKFLSKDNGRYDGILCCFLFSFQVVSFFFVNISCIRHLAKGSWKKRRREREKQDSTELIKWNILFFFSSDNGLCLSLLHIWRLIWWRCRTSVAKLNKASSPFRVCVHVWNGDLNERTYHGEHNRFLAVSIGYCCVFCIDATNELPKLFILQRQCLWDAAMLYVVEMLSINCLNSDK